MSLFKPYTETIPEFLHNRPKGFVEHCLKRLKSISDQGITETATGFAVRSSDSNEIYSLDLKSDIPSCSCEDYQISHWPCKHMLSVLVYIPGYGWESLPPTYTSLPCFSLDKEIIGESETTDVPEISQSAESVTLTASQSSTEDQLRKRCFEVLKNLETGLYGVTDLKALQTVEGKLEEADEILHSAFPKRCGLPLRRKRRHKLPHKKTSKLQKVTTKAVIAKPSKVTLLPEVEMQSGSQCQQSMFHARSVLPSD